MILKGWGQQCVKQNFYAFLITVFNYFGCKSIAWQNIEASKCTFLLTHETFPCIQVLKTLSEKVKYHLGEGLRKVLKIEKEYHEFFEWIWNFLNLNRR